MNALRLEVVGTSSRSVEWELGDRGTLSERDEAKSTADRPVFRVTLPPRGDDQKAVKVEHTFNVIIKNEW
jgi:hypothetical protein